jgi:hypothetical protein
VGTRRTALKLVSQMVWLLGALWVFCTAVVLLDRFA